jgi:hypothetical protein
LDQKRQVESKGSITTKYFARPKPAKPHRVPEWKIQAAIMARFHQMEDEGFPFTTAGDLNGVRLSARQAQKAKLTGMTAGETDIRIYMDHGRLKMIELKAKGGKRSDVQIARHALLKSLGFEVVTVKATDEQDGIDQCVAWVNKWEKETVH